MGVFERSLFLSTFTGIWIAGLKEEALVCGLMGNIWGT